jgi:ACR3 family arsenite efflux pump ArsB
LLSGPKVTELFPRPKNPPTVFGGLVLIGVVIVISAVSIYVFGSHADSTLTIILVAIGLILIVLAFPVYKWERGQNHYGGKKFNSRTLLHYFF